MSESESSGISGWVDLSLPSTLQTFIENPQNFILGAVLSGLLEWVFGAVSIVIDTILLVIAGSEPTTFDAPGERFGIADIPVSVASNLGGVGGTVGAAIITGDRGGQRTTVRGGVVCRAVLADHPHSDHHR